MRNELPRRSFQKECGVINLDSSENPGTHWVAYVKLNDYVEYFDSYGNLKPPKEFVKYAGSNINYNYTNVQGNNSYKCGHHCLRFLTEFWRDRSQ